MKITDSRLKRMREKLDLSLDNVAKACGCYRSAVWRWEKMSSEPQARYRRRYAKTLGVTVGQLGQLVYEDSVKVAE